MSALADQELVVLLPHPPPHWWTDMELALMVGQHVQVTVSNIGYEGKVTRAAKAGEVDDAAMVCSHVELHVGVTEQD